MNLEMLERQHREAHARARTYLDRSKEQATREHRELTDIERGYAQKLLDEAQGIKAQLDRAKGDTNMRTEIERFTGVSGAPRQRVPVGGGHLSGGSFVAQIMGGIGDWLDETRGRRGTRFASPVVEVGHPFAETLTTDDGSPGSGGALIPGDYRPIIIESPTRALAMADLIAPGTTDSNSIIYPRETVFDNTADTIPEGQVKPEGTLRFEQVTDPVHTIAIWLPVSEQMLEDAPAFRSYLDARLRLAVQLAEDDKLLNGASSPNELIGIRNRSDLADPVIVGGVSGEFDADAISRQIAAIKTNSGFSPDGIVMHPTNWQRIQVMKDGAGAYVGASPFAAPQTPRLWGLPVVVTPAIDEGTALVGAFRTAAQIFRKGGIRVEVSNSHSDYFIRNLVAVRSEERLALAVYRPAAFGEVTGLGS